MGGGVIVCLLVVRMMFGLNGVFAGAGVAMLLAGLMFGGLQKAKVRTPTAQSAVFDG